MGRIAVAILARRGEKIQHLRLEASDPGTALLVTDINVAQGSAELWDGDVYLARVIKHGGAHATFWEIGSR